MNSHRLTPQQPRRAIFISLAFLIGATAHSDAAMLKRAELTAVVNEVRLIENGRPERQAGVRDVVQGDASVKTGIKSRAELLFQDRTLTRLGANTLFSFDEGTRTLELDHGTMLLQAPKGMGGARIRTAAVTAAITGTTILLEYSPVAWTRTQPRGVSPFVAAMSPEQCVLELQKPSRSYSPAELAELRRKAALAKKGGGFVKVMVLEGTLRLYLNNRVGESVLLSAGHMIILNPTASIIPPSVEFDIARLSSTSLLVNNRYWGGAGADLNMALVSREITAQDKLKGAGDLSPTGLRILGGGTNVIVGGEDIYAQLDRSQTANVITNLASNNQSASSPPVTQANNSSQSSGSSVLPDQVSKPPPGDSLSIELPQFAIEGSSATTIADPPATSSAVTGNAAVVPSLLGATPAQTVSPTNGTNFTLLSTGGAVDPDGAEARSASRVVRSYSLPTLGTNDRRFLSLDYRFLSDETNQSGSFADRFDIHVSDGTQSIVYSIDRDALSPGGNGVLTPLARAGVGGFQAGTDWLPFSIDISPLGNHPTVSFLIFDRGDPVVDSAATLDNVNIVKNPAAPGSSVLPGTLTLTLNSVTFGSAAGEFTIPNLEGAAALDGTGPAADAGTLSVKTTGAITLNGPLNASTGANGTGATFGGKGGSVDFSSTGGEIAINSAVKVSESSTLTGKASSAGGTIRMRSERTTGAAITINNTGELLALLNATAPGAGGKIELTSKGGTIHVNGGKLTADRGTIDIHTDAASAAGNVQLTAAQLAADIVKVGALGTEGQLTITAGSQVSATSLLRLYGGEGATGKVLFTGSGTVTLNGSQIDIAGKTVQIDGSTKVQNNGTTAVYTDNQQFGVGAGNGNFQNPVTTHGLSSRPAF